MLTTTYIPGVGANWQSVGGQLLASAVLLLCGHQDLGLRPRMSSAFWFLMAVACGVSALLTAMRAGLLSAALICAVVLCSEAWLILRWMLRSRSNSKSQ